jgi:hypothetical protein
VLAVLSIATGSTAPVGRARGLNIRPSGLSELFVQIRERLLQHGAVRRLRRTLQIRFDSGPRQLERPSSRIYRRCGLVPRSFAASVILLRLDRLAFPPTSHLSHRHPFPHFRTSALQHFRTSALPHFSILP